MIESRRNRGMTLEYEIRLCRDLEAENARLRDALEKYRGQVDNEGEHSAADALSTD